MKCPECGDKIQDRVIDSRQSKDGESIRRRRECYACGHKWTTYERETEYNRIDEILMNIQKSTEAFKVDIQEFMKALKGTL